MKRLLRGSAVLGLGFLVAAAVDGCGSSTREFGDGGAGTAGSSASGGESGEGPAQNGGRGSVAGNGGSTEAGASEGGAAGQSTSGGMSGEGGAAGADCGEACACDGHPCDCAEGDLRSCKDGGLLGSCAAGTQTCGADRHWGACSIQPKSQDTCATNNDDTCNGAVNEGCPCVQGQQRNCSDGGFVGKCATGKQTCTASATWGACSIVPAAADTCVLNNNDNCSGAANEGCLCIEGVTTRPCGVCQDGTQTCTTGKTDQFGACVGGTTMKTYYLDADGDGHAVNVSTTKCGPAPAGYIAGPVDDCYDSNKDVFPGQTTTFSVQRGDGSFDYNCDSVEEPSVKQGDQIGCGSCNADCSACTSPGVISTTAPCGGTFGVCSCYSAPGCGLHCNGATQYCR